jgi:hypothetical protein
MSRVRLSVTTCICLAAASICCWSGAAGEVGFAFLDQPADGEYNVVCPVPAQAGAELRVAFDVSGPNDLSYVSLANGKTALFRVVGGTSRPVGEAQAHKGDSLTVQRREGRVRVTVGASVVLDVPWEGPLGG